MVLQKLVRRCCAPIVVSRASKEQLCLSLASIAQLYPCELNALQPTVSRAQERVRRATPARLAETESAALASRATLLVPSCSGRELGMIVRGGAALGGVRPEFIDAMAKEMLWRFEEGSDKGPSSSVRNAPRLQDLTQLLLAAIVSGNAFNATLRQLAVQHGPKLLERSAAMAREESVRQFLQAAEIYFGGGEEVREVVEALRAAAERRGFAELAALLSDDGVAAHARNPVTGSWVAHRRAMWGCLAQRADDTEDDAGARSNAPTVEMKARRHLYEIAGQTARTGKSPTVAPSAEAVLEAMREVAHYRLVDPVAQRALEAAAWGLAVRSPADALRVADAAFAHPHTFRLLCDKLRARKKDDNNNGNGAGTEGQSSAGSSTQHTALQRVGVVRAAYEAMRAGERASEETLLSISQQFDSAKRDEAAQAAALFATHKELPLQLVSAVRAASPRLSLGGLAALLWATRKDQTGSLLVAAEAAMVRYTKAYQLREGSRGSAPLEDVAALAQALFRLSPPRHIPLTSSFLDVEARVTSALADLLVEFVLARDGGGPKLTDLLHVGVLTAGRSSTEEFATLLCDRTAKSSSRALSPEEVALAMLLLLARDDLVHEALSDRIAVRFRSLVHSCVAGEAGAPENMLQMARLHAHLDAPELEGSVMELLRHAQAAVENRSVDSVLSSSAESLAAAALLAIHVKRHGTAEVLMTRLTSLLALQAQEGRWLAPACVEGVADLVTRATASSPAQAAALTEALVPHLGNWKPTRDIAGPLSSADTLTGFVAAYLRLCTSDTSFFGTNTDTTAAASPTSPIPESVVAFTESRLLVGVSPPVFTALCVSLYRASTAAPFASHLANTVVDLLPRRLDTLTTTQIAQCVWGLGQLPDAGQRLNHQLMTEAVSDYVIDCAELFWSGPDIAAMLYGFSRLHCTKRGLYSVFCNRLSSRAVRATISRASVGLVLSALGTVKFLDKDLFDRFAASYARHAPTLTPADVLQSVKAHSRVMLLSDTFYDAMAHEVVRRPSATFPLAAKCELLHAYGAVGQAGDAMAARLVADIGNEVERLSSANAAADVLTSLWHMNYDMAHDASVQPIVEHMVVHASELSSASLLKLSSVLADSTWQLPGLLKALGDQCVRLRRAEDLTPEAARSTLDVLARYNYCHRLARQEAAQLARTVSKDVPQLSEEEEEQLNLALSR